MPPSSVVIATSKPSSSDCVVHRPPNTTAPPAHSTACIRVSATGSRSTAARSFSVGAPPALKVRTTGLASRSPRMVPTSSASPR